ncbi:MAG: ADP-ribosylglycohydrolase family protein [Planctomycetota bacterium]
MDICSLMEGVAAGDALGVTSEFQSLEEVRITYQLNHCSGWPFAAIGGGPFGFRARRPTDDAEMALAIVKAWCETGEAENKASTYFCGARIAANFVAWLNSKPRDIGHATRSTLSAVRAGTAWYRGGRNFWLNRGHAWSNGSLMRNGVVAGMGKNDYEVFRHTLHHGLITHWAPLPAICCAAQSWLIRNGEELFEGEEGQQVLPSSWVTQFRREWDFWLCTDDDAVVKEWRDETWEEHSEAWSVFEAADFHPDSFRPFAPIEHMGFCLTTLQIGVWAMQWAYRETPYPTQWLPEAFPTDPFLKTGAEVLSWVAMIGRDSDTYGATAGPMIAAVQSLRRDLVETLFAVEEMPLEIPEPRCYSSTASMIPGRWPEPWNELFGIKKYVLKEGEALAKHVALMDICEPHKLSALEDGAPLKALAHVTEDYVLVAQVAYSWDGPHDLRLDFIPYSTRRAQDATPEWLRESLTAAEKLRAASFFQCTQCGETFAPEHGFGDFCHGCMARSGIRF